MTATGWTLPTIWGQVRRVGSASRTNLGRHNEPHGPHSGPTSRSRVSSRIGRVCGRALARLPQILLAVLGDDLLFGLAEDLVLSADLGEGLYGPVDVVELVAGG